MSYSIVASSPQSTECRVEGLSRSGVSSNICLGETNLPDSFRLPGKVHKKIESCRHWWFRNFALK
jgi:hypothetical protein